MLLLRNRNEHDKSQRKIVEKIRKCILQDASRCEEKRGTVGGLAIVENSKKKCRLSRECSSVDPRRGSQICTKEMQTYKYMGKLDKSYFHPFNI